MESYKCVVYDEKNKRKILNLDFESEEAVLKYAKENNLKVSSVKKRKPVLKIEQKLKDKELRVLCKEIGILFESGYEIISLLEVLEEQASKKLKPIFRKILNEIEEGNSITESFRNTNQFSKFFVSMIQAGELSSNLDEVMYNLSDYYDKEAKLKSKIKSALMYPVILFITTIICGLFMLIFIMPQYELIYAGTNVELPIVTKVMLFLSWSIRNNYMLILLVGFVFIVSVIYLIKNNEEFSTEIYKLSLRAPVIGNIRILSLTNRFSNSLYILIKSGVQIVESLEISGKVIDKEYIYKKICIANNFVKEGNEIGYALKEIDVFPQLFITMVTIGESSGRLEETLDTINKFYKNELEEKIDIATKLCENGMMLFMGIFVGFIVISMLMPMFNMISAL